MIRQDVLMILADLLDAGYEAGAKDPDETVDVDPYVDRVMALFERTWIGEAKAAFDQAYTEATRAMDARQEFPGPSFWLDRAQAGAAIASAEQARIANLLAWKAMQAQIAAGPVGHTPDRVEHEIEEGLGLE